MRVTNEKNCYCHTCNKPLHYLGITRHRKAHLDKNESCEITYTNGKTFIHKALKLNSKPLEAFWQSSV